MSLEDQLQQLGAKIDALAATIETAEASRAEALKKFDETASKASGTKTTAGKSTTGTKTTAAKTTTKTTAAKKTESDDSGEADAADEKAASTKSSAKSKTQETSRPEPRTDVDPKSAREAGAKLMDVDEGSEREERMSRVRAGLDHLGEKKITTIEDQDSLRKITFYLDLWNAGFDVDFEEADAEVEKATEAASDEVDDGVM